MKLPSPKKLAEIAKLLDAEFVGNADLLISGLNEIHRVEQGDVVFCDHPKYYEKALKSVASVVLINKKIDCPENKGLIICDDPFRSYNFLINFFSAFHFPGEQNDNIKIGSNCKIHPSVVVGNDVEIGENCIIYPNVTIYGNTQIGNNVIIHSGVVIGASAFYYKKRPDGYDRLLSCGEVIIKDNVELGAGTTIDRGVSAATIIGRGTKIDNHVQVGHDTILGDNCLIAAQVGIAGCVNIGNNVTLWGQVGIASGVTIGDNAVLLAQSGVGKSLAGDTVYFGSPAEEAKKMMKQLASIRILPKVIATLKQ